MHGVFYLNFENPTLPVGYRNLKQFGSFEADHTSGTFTHPLANSYVSPSEDGFDRQMRYQNTPSTIQDISTLGK